ncbi:alpha/beta hydrolase [Paraburkholderia unamae]|uniref:alpha/beta hydrolase n=1 Tax=Paraburkholderia unamae TaxID=219649 RepID=UPI001AD83FC2|nr:alpha/beta hydrolase [Paraburkholderia unamae]
MIYLSPSSVLDAPPDDSIFRSVQIDVPSGDRLIVWVAAPASRDVPTVVFFHGNGADRRDFAEMGEALHQRGWGAVLASYRGYSGNPGEPTEEGLMADARATLVAAGSFCGPLILWGHSLGSGVAARMASEGLATALVLEAPYTSLTDLAALRFPMLPARWILIDTFDTAALVPRIGVPVLIIHGMDDPEIPVSMGLKLANLWGARACFMPLEGCVGHSPHHILDLPAVVVRWMNGELSSSAVEPVKSVA